MSASEAVKRKHVYKVGDKVRVVTPKFVERVGYALRAGDLVDEFEAHPKIGAALALLGIPTGERVRREFINGCCRAAVEARGFGGKERSIYHYDRVVGYAGYVTQVYSKRTVRTGTYYPPSSGQDWDGGYYHEPGGLENAKSHVLLSTDAGEIEACNVEPVT